MKNVAATAAGLFSGPFGVLSVMDPRQRAAFYRLAYLIDNMLFSEKTAYSLFHIRWVFRGKTNSYRKDNVIPRWDESPVLSKEFPDDSLDSVSLYRPFQPAMNTDPESVFSIIVRDENQAEVVALDSFPSPVDFIEFP